MLATGQFIMALDSSVMNVSIATVAEDVGTTVTGIQTAITLYTLVMACLMIPGGKIGSIIGRRRAFSIGCVIYAAGSLTTALAPSLPILIIGWSFLEGIGAALIMPAIVALVAGNFEVKARPKAYGLIAAAAAMAIAVGPLIGGLVTTYASWRYVFVGEVVVIVVLLVFARRVKDAPVEQRPHLDLIGAVLCAIGLALDRPRRAAFFRVGLGRAQGRRDLVAGPLADDLVHPRRRPRPLALPPLVVAPRPGRQGAAGRPRALPRPSADRRPRHVLPPVPAADGIFFVIPLFLSVVLGMTASQTGVRLLPLSAGLLVAAVGVPKRWPKASPRRVCRVGLLLILAGIVLLLGGIDLDASAAWSSSRCCSSASASARSPPSSGP